MLTSKYRTNNTSKNSFTDGTKKCILANGEEETVFTDGTVQRVNQNKVVSII